MKNKIEKLVAMHSIYRYNLHGKLEYYSAHFFWRRSYYDKFPQVKALSVINGTRFVLVRYSETWAMQTENDR